MLILSKKRLFFALFLSGALLVGNAQPMEETYDYFIFPIKPGYRNTLAGTMGELRSSHLHTGIDIRTAGVQGLAVLAAADGYVSRVKVSTTGYGNTIYVRHPNGKTSVYAHLKSFRPDIEAYVKDAQYRKESFEVNLFPKPNMFVVNKADTIALSGNSGSSGGPHLHFDIRDENQNLLNPLSFGFKEVIDSRSPFAKSIAFVTFDKNARVNGTFGRTELTLTDKGDSYVLTDTIAAIGTLGLELYAWDRMNGTRFKTGINTIKFTLNNQEVFGQKINTWSFKSARSFYQHIDYNTLVTSGKRYAKLYVDNGNSLNFYDHTPQHGQFIIQQGKYYKAEISMKDSYGNTSYIKFVIYGDETSTPAGSNDTKNSYSILKNIMKIVGDSASNNIRLRVGNETKQVQPDYIDKNGYPVYLWDLSNASPQAILFSDTTLFPKLISKVPANQEYKVFNHYADIVFDKRSLFDTLYFKLDYALDTINHQEKLIIGDPTIPIKGSIKVIAKPYYQPKHPEHTAVYQMYGKNNYTYAGGKWKEQQQQVEFPIRNFGTFTILEDSIPPKIKPLIVNRDNIVFKLDDRLSGIKQVKAYLNNEWLLMARDLKNKQYWAEKHYAGDNYAGKFLLEVTDNANNTKTYTTNIK